VRPDRVHQVEVAVAPRTDVERAHLARHPHLPGQCLSERLVDPRVEIADGEGRRGIVPARWRCIGPLVASTSRTSRDAPSSDGRLASGRHGHRLGPGCHQTRRLGPRRAGWALDAPAGPSTRRLGPRRAGWARLAA
jgi:hypothetical protein